MTKEEVIEFYNDNGVSLLKENGQLCELYFDQVISDTFKYNENTHVYDYVGGN